MSARHRNARVKGCDRRLGEFLFGVKGMGDDLVLLTQYSGYVKNK
jgi:hypothetical protein